MIVRIHMDDQYRLSDDAVAEVDRLDDQLLQAVNGNNQEAFARTLDELIGYVRTRGEKVPLEELVASDLILPSEDVTMEEARAIMEKAATTEHISGQAAPEA